MGRSAGFLLLFLLLFVAALLSQRPNAPHPLYAPGGDGPDGLLLLQEWLEEMGYRVDETGRTAFAPGPAHLLFVYPGVHPFSPEEVVRLTAWVEAGGSLALVAVDDDELSRTFDFSLMDGGIAGRLVQSQPLLPGASSVITGTNFSRRLGLPGDSKAVTLLAEEGGLARPGLAVLGMGAGWVWLLSEDFTLTNQRLTDDRSTAQVVPALLRAVPPGGQVRFDTYHLFGPAEGATGQIDSLQEWAYRTPTGWAAIFLLLLGFGYLLLQGRRLGPPLQTITQGRRREAAEFVVAMAGLQRRAGLRDSIARHQLRQLKERLGRGLGLPPDLPDGDLLAHLSSPQSGLTGEQVERLGHLLAALAANPDEATLVRLAGEAESFGVTGNRSGAGLAGKDRAVR
ncbi:MAG: DUF4350 domain-containing protein [Caldilineaceae bacterium]|nr:DUF4350 domain-containing protein [Caldilineaceae bacterium]